MTFEEEISKGIVVAPLIYHYLDRKRTKAGTHVLTRFHHKSGRFEVKTSRFVDLLAYVDDNYKMSSYLSTWTSEFWVVHGQSVWPPYEGFFIVPRQEWKRRKGRLRTNCIRNEMDVCRTRGDIRCCQCQQVRHNTRTCASRASSSAPSHRRKCRQ
ncbi:hypothetical protein Droror1_Dr00012319 [Drosera rotundifolia]